MDLFIEITLGEPLGTRFKLANGLKIGRRNCEILIDDPKISSYHATIVARGPANQQKFYLKDNNSSNGIKFNDQRVPELYLAPGVEFKLGNTFLKVIDATPKAVEAKIEPKPEKPKQSEKQKAMDKIKAHLSLPEKAVAPKVMLPTPPPVLAPEPIPEPIEEIPPTWQQTLMKLIQNASLRAEDILTDGLAAFNPPLKLRCIRGKQFGKNWLLGYGPRTVGPKSLDLVLNESAAPPICFQVIPTLTGAEFKTQHPEIVKYNGQSVARAILQSGDMIEVLNSQLVVDFDHARN